MNDKLKTFNGKDDEPFYQEKHSSLTSAKLTATAKYERTWLEKNTTPSILKKTLEDELIHLITKHKKITGQKIVELGARNGSLTIKLAELGGIIDAVDIASNALKKIPKHINIQLIQDFIPNTMLKDFSYDVVIAKDLILKLPKTFYRLFFSELVRLTAPNGVIFCSTPLDFKTENPLEAFLNLAETEVEIIEYVVRYDRLWLSGKDLLSKLPFAQKKWAKSQMCLKFLQSATKFIYDQEGISHVTLVARKRPLFVTPQKIAPLERPAKKSVWE